MLWSHIFQQPVVDGSSPTVLGDEQTNRQQQELLIICFIIYLVRSTSETKHVQSRVTRVHVCNDVHSGDITTATLWDMKLDLKALVVPPL